MKALAGGFRLLLFIVVGALMAATQTQAGESCHKINANGIGQDLGGGMTVGDVLGGGLLEGTTEASFTVTGFSGTVATIAGDVEFTTNRGTLTVAVTGTFDVVTGEFSASGPVTGATGKLAGATGTLSFDGVENLSDGTFVDDITGEICVDLSPSSV